MADDAERPKVTITDPDNVPVTYASGAFTAIWNGMVAVTLVTNRLTPIPDPEGDKINVENDHVIVGRLRLDLHAATTLRDRLNLVIAGLTKPDGKPN